MDDQLGSSVGKPKEDSIVVGFGGGSPQVASFIQARWRRYCMRKATEGRRREEATDFVEDQLSSGASSLATMLYASKFTANALRGVQRSRDMKGAMELMKLRKPHMPDFTEDDDAA